ncbi:TonB family protein [Pontibacter akesuensis]|uniref:Outer membrane transport energization protein TonB n=1 Tax=Pontibacter akesuensis TaxID=388950 RepID=A0A1I7IJ12_9BACT|nr:TonB family protein [Pontibacter akesuensis]GHA67439.1 cell envelope biogenesis protein TonB [Pontibacter akesuensis]SFU72921.1 outer membrane transport energization protein TonB [Pontibacter akesuensis]
MEKSYFLSMTFNNIVFKGRNQAYGAYLLRKAYNNHIMLAALLATALFSGALVIPLVQNIFFEEPVKYKQPTAVVITPIDIVLPPPPVEPKPAEAAVVPPAPKEKVATEKYVTTKVVSDETDTPEELPDQAALKEANIGTEKIEGVAPTVPSIELTEAPPIGIEGGTGEVKETNEPFLTADQMPEFNGGEKALFNFLSKKMRYPAAAQSAGVEGTVVVTFVVGTTGEITDIQVLKGLGYGTEEEAKRVISSMPKWKPGKQSGRAVPVRYTLPIRFNLQ